MKSYFLQLLIILCLLSCTSENTEVMKNFKSSSVATIGGDPCYRFGVTRAECESNEQCAFNTPSILYALKENKPEDTYGYSYEDIFIKNGGSGNYFGITVCRKKNSPHTLDNKSTEGNFVNFCIQFAPRMWLSLVFFDDDLDKVPPGWKLCSELDIPEMNTVGLCGNGVIEPGETCDGTEFGAPSDCAEYSEVTGEGDYTGGEIYCSGCLRRFDQCTTGSKQGE